MMSKKDQNEINAAFPHKVEGEIVGLSNTTGWCTEHLGADGLWHGYYHPNTLWGWLYSDDNMQPIFYFRNIRDAVEFKLRFG